MKPSAVIVLAALSLGCPQKRWFLDAQAPPNAKDTKVERVVSISASHEAEVDIGHDGDWHRAEPVAPVTWPGTATYVVPVGVQLGRVQITKSCGAGCNECIPPRDGSEYIRIDRVDVR